MIDCDFLIIGGGVAALTAAQYASRSLLDTVVLTGTEAFGGQTGEIAQLENYPGVYPPVAGLAFIDTMTSQAKHFGAKLVCDEAKALDKVAGRFIVQGRTERYRAYTALIATGAMARRLGVKGEAELIGRGVSYCATCDGPFFRDKRIVVVGGGDSALSEALYLATLSPHITIVHRRLDFRANRALVERVKEKDIKVEMGSVVKEIAGEERVEAVILQQGGADGNGGEKKIECDAVFVCIGRTPAASIVDFLQKDSAGYLVTDEKMQTACTALFAAGDVRSTPLRQVITAASDGAVAAYAAVEYVRATVK